ncbi:TetR/AcrR family transcriptional regulator [Halopseudomonas formosensis]|uniref:TetR/AcrR family transcriptional regulator n=1 Tax=Halopseudomonas formosensis TaxID=1002526 RepID=A0A1I6BIU5_9GAMM|nr:TetR/AcrR family transcriptional regulator [Halopseudomonas formosensis]MDX9686620.1 TetR/AcrR family transcriptional regulator [Halopseudomonas formosensis]MDY3196947.1 TetR/AcrR family transcriptional regulator [Pseudomonadaceae bacterium]NLC00523.1 TetR/AcrR family transcriptional regulator [Halopseudomonas formosensis]SFQ80849.1 transcriptional regulator, TetR family [Halopseudomonas formosensis]
MDSSNQKQTQSLHLSLFRAAEAIVSELGASQLTFATLSERTGVDEATLSTLFPNREALLTAMIEHRLERFRVRWNAYESVLPDEPMRELKALLLSNMSESTEEKNLDSAIFAAAASNPALLQTTSDDVQGLFNILEKSPLGLAQAAVLFFSVRGYRLFEQIGICPMTDSQRTEFQEQIMRLARLMYEQKSEE